MNPSIYCRLASLLIILLSALLAWRGIEILSLPPMYKLLRTRNLFLNYEGYFLILAAMTLICLHRQVITKMLWVAQEIHRIVLAMLMAGVVGIDAMMHLFNIPHMEGWWLPLFGSGAAVSIISGWIHGRKK